MSATILPFVRPDREKPANQDALTKKEFHQRVTEETLHTLRKLVQYLKDTGHWQDANCEKPMTKAVQSIKDVVDVLADNREKNLKTPENPDEPPTKTETAC